MMSLPLLKRCDPDTREPNSSGPVSGAPIPSRKPNQNRSRRRVILGALLPLLFAALLPLVACSDSPTEPCSQPVNVTGDIVAPVRISGDQPQYTEEARQARIQGIVILRLVIDCDGNVTSITPIQELPLGLTESAIDAARTFRYRPATLNGTAISVFYNATFNFRLQ